MGGLIAENAPWCHLDCGMAASIRMAGGALAGSLLTIWAARDATRKPQGAAQVMAAAKTRRRPTGMKIAVVPGDGIGNEVVPEGIRVLEAVGARFGIDYAWDHYDWSCQRFAKTGAMMPADGLEQIAKHDAIYLGAVGWPGVPDHVSLWGLLIPIRRGFQQYVNLRPVRLFEGLKSPARRPQARRHRLLHRAREQRGRVFLRSAGASFEGTELEAGDPGGRCSPRRAATA